MKGLNMQNKFMLAKSYHNCRMHMMYEARVGQQTPKNCIEVKMQWRGRSIKTKGYSPLV